HRLARILMGSVTRRVIQQLPCSLVTVKPEEIADEEFTCDVKTIKILYAEGRALLEAKSYDAALAKFNQVLARNPYHAGALPPRDHDWSLADGQECPSYSMGRL